MTVLDKRSPQNEASQYNQQAVELNDADNLCAKTKQEQDTFPKPTKEGCHLDDPKQVEAIYHYLLIVVDDNNSDKYRYNAAKHLATYYYKRPIYPKAWEVNEKRILKELNNTVKEYGAHTARIEREIPCLFEAVNVIKDGQ